MIKRFIGLFSGFALIAGILGGFLVTIGSYENLASNKPFIVCSSLEQLRDFNLQRANYDARIEQGDNPVLVLASSELNTYLILLHSGPTIITVWTSWQKAMPTFVAYGMLLQLAHSTRGK